MPQSFPVRRAFAIVWAAVALAGLLAACGGDNDGANGGGCFLGGGNYRDNSDRGVYSHPYKNYQYGISLAQSDWCIRCTRFCNVAQQILYPKRKTRSYLTGFL